MNPLDVEVSYYPGHANDVKSTATVNLYSYLTKPSLEQIAIVQGVRSCPDPKKQNELKKAVGGITPSGIFSPSRSDANLIKHSGIITLDVDADKNPGLDFTEFRSRVQSFEWVAACMISVRGGGLAIYVPIEEPERHREHFYSLAAYFGNMGVNVDPTCVNLSRLRFNSYDPVTYTNTSATRYNRQLSKTDHKPRGVTLKATATPKDLFGWASEQVKRKGVFFVDGSKHDFITRLSEILNRYGVPEAEVWEHVSTNYIPRSEIRSNCISGPYRQYANEHGTRTYKPAKDPKRLSYVKHFPKRKVAPNPTSFVDWQPPQPKWEEVPSFEWEFSIPETATPKPTQTDTHPEQEAYLPIEIPQPEYYFKELEQPTSMDWVQCIADLETFFAQSTLPTQEVRLNQWTTVTNAHLFIEGHLTTVKANRGNSLFLPYLERLQQLQQALNTSSENENENAGIDQ